MGKAKGFTQKVTCACGGPLTCPHLTGGGVTRRGLAAALVKAATGKSK